MPRLSLLLKKLTVGVVVFGTCLIGLWAGECLAQKVPAKRLTNGSNVRLRTSPDATSPTVSELALGTELSVLERRTSADSWFRVRTDDGREGWVSGRLTTPFDSEHYIATVEAIAVAQLKSHSEIRGTSFAVRVQLFDLIERTSRRVNDREVSARFAWYRLRSMVDVFAAIPFGADHDDPYERWVTNHWDEGLRDAPSGTWKIEPAFVLKIHDEYRETTAADDIAWFYVTNGAGGECQGFLPCYVGEIDALYGEYLRRHPGGRHREEAIATIEKNLDIAGDRDALDCPSFRELLQSLASAITSSRSARTASALTALRKIAELSAICR
jgi:hypothetical protein